MTEPMNHPNRRKRHPIVIDSTDRPDRWEQINRAAAALNMKAAEWIRHACDVQLDRTGEVGPDPFEVPPMPDRPDVDAHDTGYETLGFVPRTEDRPKPDVHPGESRVLDTARAVLVGRRIRAPRRPTRWQGDTASGVVTSVEAYWPDTDTLWMTLDGRVDVSITVEDVGGL